MFLSSVTHRAHDTPRKLPQVKLTHVKNYACTHMQQLHATAMTHKSMGLKLGHKHSITRCSKGVVQNSGEGVVSGPILWSLQIC